MQVSMAHAVMLMKMREARFASIRSKIRISRRPLFSGQLRSWQ